MTPEMTPDWSPFKVAPPGQRPDPTRGVSTREGVTDRLRAAAFAEIQAREAFLWAARRFEDAPDRLKAAWRGLAKAEERHLGWLLKRLEELGEKPDARAVSDQLWISLSSCRSAREFALYMASAEERGRQAGLRFHEAMAAHDPVSAAIFGRIAEEELDHIRLAETHFPGEKLERPRGLTTAAAPADPAEAASSA